MNNKPAIPQISLNQIYKNILASSNLHKYILYILIIIIINNTQGGYVRENIDNRERD